MFMYIHRVLFEDTGAVGVTELVVVFCMCVRVCL